MLEHECSRAGCGLRMPHQVLPIPLHLGMFFLALLSRCFPEQMLIEMENEANQALEQHERECEFRQVLCPGSNKTCKLFLPYRFLCFFVFCTCLFLVFICFFVCPRSNKTCKLFMPYRFICFVLFLLVCCSVFFFVWCAFLSLFVSFCFLLVCLSRKQQDLPTISAFLQGGWLPRHNLPRHIKGCGKEW